MNVKFINPFVESASEVIQLETGVSLQRGDLGLEKVPYQTDDITVILALVGMVNGNVLYSLSFPTAIALVGCTFAKAGSLELVRNEVAGKRISLSTTASIALDPAFQARVEPGPGTIAVRSDLPGLAAPAG